jgi:tetratricopeptide (TPR) repeat protein
MFVHSRNVRAKMKRLSAETRATSSKIFVSYSHKDEKWWERLRIHLTPLIDQASLVVWADTEIRAGQEWRLAIEAAIASAQVAVLLVTADYLASDFIQQTELPRLFEAATKRGLLVLWIAVNASLYEDARFAKYESLNDPKKPLATLSPTKREAELVRIVRRIREVVAATAPPYSKDRSFMVPHHRNPVFTGREDVLGLLKTKIKAQRVGSLSQIQAITGLGGIGKTQIALEYTYRYREDYTWVFWVVAATEETLSSGFARIARLLELPEGAARDLEQTRDAVRRWLETNEQWLLVFDDVDDPELLGSYLPGQHSGHILLTSRTQVLQSAGLFFQPIVVDVLSPKEALEFLHRRTGREIKDSMEWVAAEQLASELDYLPLALEQAAAYIFTHGTRFRDYVVSFRKRRLQLLQRQNPITGRYPHSVATTWELNFSKVKQLPASADLLRLSAFLAPEDVPLDLLAEGFVQLDIPLKEAIRDFADDPVVLDDVLEPLTRYSLVRRHPRLQAYSMHRLTQAVIRTSLNESERQLWAKRSVIAIAHVFPTGNFEAWPVCQRLAPHAIVCADWIQEWNCEFEQSAVLLTELGYYLTEKAQYDAGERLERLALTICNRVLGPQHLQTATTLNNLARLCRLQGRFEDAEPLYRQALAIHEAVLGNDDPDTAISLNNLALLYRAQGRLKDAEPLYLRCLALYEAALGSDHPHTATTLNNLARLYHEQGRLRSAEELFRRALSIREKVLGADHPHTAISLNNLAEVYRDEGITKDAEDLFRRALTIRENTLGAEHPDTAGSLNSLADLYRAEGRLGDAEPLFRRVLDIYERVLGREHPNTAVILNNLGRLYRDMNLLSDAEPLFRRALAIRQKTVGSHHPDTATSLNNLADLYRAEGRLSEAEPLLGEALAIYETALGTDHPYTAASLNNLAQVYRDQKRYNDAEPLFSRALAINERVLGPQHPDTIRVRDKLQALHHERGTG